jgi:putative ABC transport system substrate-binding protein
MLRRAVLAFLLVLGFCPIGVVHDARAQAPAKVYRVGWLSVGTPASAGPQVDALKRELGPLGYVEGQNLVFDVRYAEGKLERLPGLAAELVALKPDVIIAPTTNGALAVKQATATIPIVITFVSDPVGSGIVSSLAQPGGNITGVTDFGIELAAKTVEMVRAVAPKVTRVAVLMSDNPTHPPQLKIIQDAARSAGLTVVSTMASAPEDLEKAFASLAKDNAGALIVLGGAPHASQREKIAELAIKGGIPTVFLTRPYVDAGGLLSYGASIRHSYDVPAIYVDKIFKGAKPGDLPIEQPTKFELVINMKTAKALGLTIPQSLLLRADELIR